MFFSRRIYSFTQIVKFPGLLYNGIERNTFMKTRLKTILTAFLFIVIAGIIPAGSQDITPTPTDAPVQEKGNGSAVICLPDAYLVDPENCNPLGPSEYLTNYVKKGGVYPDPPFTGKKLDPSLSEVPYEYARINADNEDIINLYNTPAEAAEGINPVGTISSGAIRYVSYDDNADIGNAHYVRSKARELWLRASPAAVTMSTLGRTFTKTPEYDFGWIVEACNPYLEADYNMGMSTEFYNREDVVNLYETIENRGDRQSRASGYAAHARPPRHRLWQPSRPPDDARRLRCLRPARWYGRE